MDNLARELLLLQQSTSRWSGDLKDTQTIPWRTVRTYTEQTNQKTHTSVNSAVNQNRSKVHFHLHHTRVTYQRSSVTQAWWWGWPPVRRERKYNLCVCKIRIERACVCDRDTHLEFPPGVELLQAFHSLLSVHHGSHSRALLWKQIGKRFFTVYLYLLFAVFV